MYSRAGEGQLAGNEHPAVDLDRVAERRDRIRRAAHHVEYAACSLRHTIRDPMKFEASFVAELPADPVRGQCAAPGRRRELHARGPDAGGGAAPARLVAARSAEYLGHGQAARGRRARGQPRAAGHAALRGALRRPPVRPLGRAARRRPRHHARRDHRHRRHAPGAAAQGRRPHALLAHRRRPRGAALLAARVRLQRGDALPRRADHARAVPGRHRRAGDPRHVLRRATRRPSPAPSSAASRPPSCASATSRSTPPTSEIGLAQAARRLRDAHALPRQLELG